MALLKNIFSFNRAFTPILCVDDLAKGIKTLYSPTLSRHMHFIPMGIVFFLGAPTDKQVKNELF